MNREEMQDEEGSSEESDIYEEPKEEMESNTSANNLSSTVSKRSHVSKLAANFENQPNKSDMMSSKGLPKQNSSSTTSGAEPHKPRSGGSTRGRGRGRGRARGRKSFSIDEGAQEVGSKKNADLRQSSSTQQQDDVDSYPKQQQSFPDKNEKRQAQFEDARHSEDSEDKNDHGSRPENQDYDPTSHPGPQSASNPLTESYHRQSHDKPPRKAIEVSGFDPGLNEEFLLLYFEDIEKSGGGDIDLFLMHPSKKVATLTFKDAAGKDEFPYKSCVKDKQDMFKIT